MISSALQRSLRILHKGGGDCISALFTFHLPNWLSHLFWFGAVRNFSVFKQTCFDCTSAHWTLIQVNAKFNFQWLSHLLQHPIFCTLLEFEAAGRGLFLDQTYLDSSRALLSHLLWFGLLVHLINFPSSQFCLLAHSVGVWGCSLYIAGALYCSLDLLAQEIVSLGLLRVALQPPTHPHAGFSSENCFQLSAATPCVGGRPFLWCNYGVILVQFCAQGCGFVPGRVCRSPCKNPPVNHGLFFLHPLHIHIIIISFWYA